MSRLHLTHPTASPLAVVERAHCGQLTRSVVGTWKHRAILFIRRSEWEQLCASCRKRAAAWMNIHGTKEPIFSFEVEANADAIRTIAPAPTAAELDVLRSMANAEPVEGRDFEEMPERHRSGRAVGFGDEVLA